MSIDRGPWSVDGGQIESFKTVLMSHAGGMKANEISAMSSGS